MGWLSRYGLAGRALFTLTRRVGGRAVDRCCLAGLASQRRGRDARVSGRLGSLVLRTRASCDQGEPRVRQGARQGGDTLGSREGVVDALFTSLGTLFRIRSILEISTAQYSLPQAPYPRRLS